MTRTIITEGMTPANFVAAINNNIAETRINNAVITDLVTSSNPVSVININCNNINAKLPVAPVSVADLSYSEKGSDFISKLNNNFANMYDAYEVRVPHSVVTFRFDEGGDHYTSWYPLLTSLSITGTLAIYYTAPQNLTWAHIRTMVAAGWDVMVHAAAFEENYNNMTEAQVDASLTAGRQAVEAQSIVCEIYGAHGSNFSRINGSGYPSATLKTHARKYYKISNSKESIVASPERLDILLTLGEAWDGQVVAAYDIKTADGMTQLKGIIDSFKNNKQWYTIVIHTYSGALGTAFTEIVNYVKAAGVDIKTTSEVYNMLERIPIWPLTSAVVEDAQPTKVVLTSDTVDTLLVANDFTVIGFTVSTLDRDVTNKILTLTLTLAVQYGNVLNLFVKNKPYSVTNNVAYKPPIPTGLVAASVNDFTRLTVDAVAGNVQVEWYDSEDGVTYSLVATTGLGVSTYDDYAWQNATMRFKARAKEGALYSSYCEAITFVTPLVYKITTVSNLTFTLNSLYVTAGYTVYVNWGDGNIEANAGVPWFNKTHLYATNQALWWMKIYGAMSYITVLSLCGDAKLYGDVSKQRVPSGAQNINFRLSNVSGDITNWIWKSTSGTMDLQKTDKTGGLLSGDLSGFIIGTACTFIRIQNNNFTDLPRGEYKNIGVNLCNASANLVDATKLDAWLHYLAVYFSTNAPTASTTYTINGTGMGKPTGGALNTDIVAIKAAYVSAGKVATFVINT